MESGRRKPRSDALRNRERLIEAAKEILGRGGPEASLEAVARAANVGIGTLYRHFPTRESLFMAVYRHEVEHLIEKAAELETSGDQVNALRCWLHALVGLVETKRGLLGALAVVKTEESMAIFAELSGRLIAAIDGLLSQGRTNGKFRPDISAEDLLSTVYAICYARQTDEHWKEQVLHLVDIFLDGMTTK